MTVLLVYPLPATKVISDRIGDTRNFSTLDLSSGYKFRYKAYESKTPLATEFGQYKYTTMSFGLYTPVTFENTVNITEAM